MSVLGDWCRRLILPADFADATAFCATNTQLREILARRVSPALPGFAYDGGYIWYGPRQGRSRCVIRVYLLKGASGLFQWGRCFDFLPVPDGGGHLRYQRTDKSVGLQLFPWSEGWFGGSAGESPWRFSRFGRNLADVENQVWAAFATARGEMSAWFARTAELSGALEEARHLAAESAPNDPEPQYVAAFLLAALGREDEGSDALSAALERRRTRGSPLPPQTEGKLRDKLRALARESGKGDNP